MERGEAEMVAMIKKYYTVNSLFDGDTCMTETSLNHTSGVGTCVTLFSDFTVSIIRLILTLYSLSFIMLVN